MRKMLLAAALVLACAVPCQAITADDWIAHVRSEADLLVNAIAELDEHYTKIGKMCVRIPDEWEFVEVEEGTGAYTYTCGEDLIAICCQDLAESAKNEDDMDYVWNELKSFWYGALSEANETVLEGSTDDKIYDLDCHQDIFHYDNGGALAYCSSVSVKCYDFLGQFLYYTEDENAPTAEQFYDVIANKTLYF